MQKANENNTECIHRNLVFSSEIIYLSLWKSKYFLFIAPFFASFLQNSFWNSRQLFVCCALFCSSRSPLHPSQSVICPTPAPTPSKPSSSMSPRIHGWLQELFLNLHLKWSSAPFGIWPVLPGTNLYFGFIQVPCPSSCCQSLLLSQSPKEHLRAQSLGLFFFFIYTLFLGGLRAVNIMHMLTPLLSISHCLLDV